MSALDFTKGSSFGNKYLLLRPALMTFSKAKDFTAGATGCAGAEPWLGTELGAVPEAVLGAEPEAPLIAGGWLEPDEFRR